MPRVTNSPASRKRRKKVLKYAKGYFGNKSKLFRYAKEAVQHAWQYAYIDRKKKRANMRGLWIVRLNAACREAGMRYSRFIEGLKARYVGHHGEFTALMKQMGAVPKEHRPAMGKLVNEAKAQLSVQLDATLARIGDAELAGQLGPAIDPTLPSPDSGPGTSHPLTLVREEMCRILRKAGFTVVEGPEVETEYYCFDALNPPADHPARDEQDTFYFPEKARFANLAKKVPTEKYLLRTHPSSVQIRTMLKGEPPIRIVSPGRVYRRDTSDATHSANFHQIECLYVDKNVTVRDLKALLDYIFAALLGTDTKTRFRPHYFGYTEPTFDAAPT